MHACTSRKGLKLSWFVVLAAKNDFIHKISTLDQQEEAQPEVTSCLLLSALTFSFFFFCQTSLLNCRTGQCWPNINQDSLTASPVSHRKHFQNFDRHFCPAWKQTEQHRREVCFCARYSVFPFTSYLTTHFSILYFYFLINLREQHHPPSISLWIICPRSSSPVWYHIPPVKPS